jgi:hypothetical protein
MLIVRLGLGIAACATDASVSSTRFAASQVSGGTAGPHRSLDPGNMLALHLIQNCMVYINTLMIKTMLAEHWQGKFTPATTRRRRR